MNWYKLTATEVLQKLGTGPKEGLTGDEAQKRLVKHGPNELVEKGAKEPWRIFLDQFKERENVDRVGQMRSRFNF